jgi:hypothetical protein
MAAKKARKRAYIPPSHEVVNRRERSEKTRTVRADRSSSASRGGRQPYAYPVPTWGRTLKRLPIYFVMILVLQYVLASAETRDLATSERIMRAAVSAGIVTVLFAPFMHLMDRWAYNRYKRRTGATAAE